VHGTGALVAVKAAQQDFLFAEEFQGCLFAIDAVKESRHSWKAVIVGQTLKQNMHKKQGFSSLRVFSVGDRRVLSSSNCFRIALISPSYSQMWRTEG
jgi:hypothetical protein